MPIVLELFAFLQLVLVLTSRMPQMLHRGAELRGNTFQTLLSETAD
jgi:hypothetical protein